MAEIELTRGLVTIVDDEDAEWLMQHKWHARLCARTELRDYFYAARNYRPAPKQTQKCLLMHRLITDAPAGMCVDHINGDGLDNRRENLRICTHAQNMLNKRSVKGRSKFRGVWKRRRKWTAGITKDGVTVRFGSYESEEEAARVHDIHAVREHGEFAVTNVDLGLLPPIAKAVK